ncbi:M24 family metallopeptidase [Jiangella asiatica]|uniref:Aminopeptidase P family protein n=1 Tax=Jiangella asiatica TaxID=2530372 RepID=A0A4R5DLN1_9ACTN|nr:Xaa-Pro peptidase family protein [Jiangella asiatica]TDE14347.1 aminopeptidase P family protein [Jiangella asiatica]
MHLPDSFYLGTLDRVVERIGAAGYDGILVTQPADVAYLVGFCYAVTERPVYLWVGADRDRFVLVPELDRQYAEQQRTHAPVVTYFEYPGVTSPEEHFADLLRHRGLAAGRVAYTSSMSVSTFGKLGAALPDVTWEVSDVVAGLRLTKAPEEIELHRQAADICDSMLAAGRAYIEEALSAGRELPREGEIARHVVGHGSDLIYQRYDHVVFTTKLAGGLVYAGPNAANPHGLPSSRRVQVGDTLILSLGASVLSRFVESERTFVIGEPSADQRRYFETARSAQHVGTEAMRVGRTCADVNAECLDVIRDAGMGEYLRHRQGHGIGVQQHEAPWVEDGDPTPLAAGMVLSSEPGVYVPGHGGYRISDTVLVTDGGPERLTTYPRTIEENVIAA